MLEFLNNIIVASVIKGAIVILALLTAFAYMTLIERRVVAKIQGRLGPNRVGPFGLFQPLADAIKMAFKEQIVPSQARKAIYLVAPIISVVVALSALGSSHWRYQCRPAVDTLNLITGSVRHCARRLGFW